MVDYQNKYFGDVSCEYEDISIVIYNGGVPVGIWPLNISRRESSESYELGSIGTTLLPPIVQEWKYNVKTLGKIYRKCIQMLADICRNYNISEVLLKGLVMDTGNSVFLQIFHEQTGVFLYDICSECFVNLLLDEDEILSRVRRTNKYSIKKANDLWKIEIITRNSDTKIIEKSFEEFENMHIEVAGRRTRSKAAWEAQCIGVKECDDFLIMMRDKESKFIGISLYTCTGSFALYSCAAYDRSLFDSPIAHLSQWEAIKHCKELGLKWYYIGYRPYENDKTNPSEKEISIGHFKEGFATNIFNSIVFKWKIL